MDCQRQLSSDSRLLLLAYLPRIRSYEFKVRSLQESGKKGRIVRTIKARAVLRSAPRVDNGTTSTTNILTWTGISRSVDLAKEYSSIASVCIEGGPGEERWKLLHLKSGIYCRPGCCTDHRVNWAFLPKCDTCFILFIV